MIAVILVADDSGGGARMHAAALAATDRLREVQID